MSACIKLFVILNFQGLRQEFQKSRCPVLIVILFGGNRALLEFSRQGPERPDSLQMRWGADKQTMYPPAVCRLLMSPDICSGELPVYQVSYLFVRWVTCLACPELKPELRFTYQPSPSLPPFFLLHYSPPSFFFSFLSFLLSSSFFLKKYFILK